MSTAIVFPLVMACLLWPLGLDGLWLNQAATYIPVGIIAFFMLRKPQKSWHPTWRKIMLENQNRSFVLVLSNVALFLFFGYDSHNQKYWEVHYV